MQDVTVIPEICVHDARRAIEFYVRAFGARDLGTHATPDGKKIMHCGLAIEGGAIFVCDDFPEASGGKARTPKALGGSSVTIHLNCADVQRTWKSAVKAGAKVVMPLERQFWGSVYGVVVDPFGQRWSMSSASAEEKADTASSEYVAGAEERYPTGAGTRAKRAQKKKRGAKRASRKA